MDMAWSVNVVIFATFLPGRSGTTQ